jgi:hypothetical protein
LSTVLPVSPANPKSPPRNCNPIVATERRVNKNAFGCLRPGFEGAFNVTAFPCLDRFGCGLDLPGYDVKSGVAHAPAFFTEPSQSALDQPLLLSDIDGQFGGAKSTAAAGLDLDEDYHLPVASDQVDLHAAYPNVLIFNAISFLSEIERSASLALVAES